jgi:hypothetical protein
MKDKTGEYRSEARGLPYVQRCPAKIELDLERRPAPAERAAACPRGSEVSSGELSDLAVLPRPALIRRLASLEDRARKDGDRSPALQQDDRERPGE